MSNRLMRINDEILRETANIIRTELNDPRIGVMTTVVNVDTTNDLRHCKIYVSIFGDAQQKKQALEGLKNASGYIRKLLAARINLRYTPELAFVLDESLDHSIKITELLNEANKKSKEQSE